MPQFTRAREDQRRWAHCTADKEEGFVSIRRAKEFVKLVRLGDSGEMPRCDGRQGSTQVSGGVSVAGLMASYERPSLGCTQALLISKCWLCSITISYFFQ